MGYIGALIGGFIVAFIIPYICLRFAGSKKRIETADGVIFRTAAIVVAATLCYATPSAGTGLAFAASAVWAMFQHIYRAE